MKAQYIEIDDYGNKFYFKDKEKNVLHREDGPAIESANGDKEWYLNGVCHRMDGPAIVTADGYKAWYINDVLIFDVDKSGNIISRMR